MLAILTNQHTFNTTTHETMLTPNPRGFPRESTIRRLAEAVKTPNHHWSFNEALRTRPGKAHYEVDKEKAVDHAKAFLANLLKTSR